MDNVTHTLAGVVTAEVLVQLRRRIDPAAAVSPGWARVAWITSALAHNLPDADMVLSPLTPGPLGYLLHHRGHTHTLLLAPLLALMAYGFARWRRRARGDAAWSRADHAWMAALALLGPLGHLALDYSNEYGVHPFWPAHDGWLYGDTIFIVEPLFWACTVPLVLAASGSRAARGVFGAVLAAGVVLVWITGFVPRPFALAATVLPALVYAAMRRAAPGPRAGLALGASLLVLLAFAVSGRAAARTVREELARSYPGWTTLDVSRSPLPATPACWQALAVQRAPGGDRYALRLLHVSAWPALWPADRCVVRLREATTAPLARSTARRAPGVVPEAEFEGDLAALRAHARRCDVGAFLRFARAPFVLAPADTRQPLVLGDLRYDREAGFGFAEMSAPRAPPARCPANVPPWTPPRADLLAP